MKFSTASALAALAPLAAAQAGTGYGNFEPTSPLAHIEASFREYFGLMASLLPHYNTYDATQAAAVKQSHNIDVLTLNNWQSTLRNSVTPASAGPEEWWVLITGGNKTCYGQCEGAEKAFNESALLFKSDPTAPHLGYIDCDLQPILCNAWATGPPALYIFEVTPNDEPVTLTLPKFNTSSVTAENLVKIHQDKSWKETAPYNGTFHPFDGEIAKYGLGQPVGWVLWVFNVLPSWLFMLLVSFATRGMMGSRLQPPRAQPGRGAPAPAAGAARK